MSGVTFGQNLLSELHLVAIPYGKTQVTDDLLQKAADKVAEIQKERVSA